MENTYLLSMKAHIAEIEADLKGLTDKPESGHRAKAEPK